MDSKPDRRGVLTRRFMLNITFKSYYIEVELSHEFNFIPKTSPSVLVANYLETVYSWLFLSFIVREALPYEYLENVKSI